MIFAQIHVAKLHILLNIHEGKSIFLQISDKLTGIKSQSVSSSTDRQVDATFCELSEISISYLLFETHDIFFFFEAFAQILRIGTGFVPFLNGGLVPEHRNHPLE